MQYIISANEDMLRSIKEYFEPNEYQEVIEKNKILELTDKSDETRLLGIQVDMDYEGEGIFIRTKRTQHGRYTGGFPLFNPSYPTGH